MPAIEKIGIKLHAPPVLLDRAIQIADGNVAAGIVKNLVGRLHFYSRNGHNGHNEQKRQAPGRNFRCVLLWALCEPILS